MTIKHLMVIPKEGEDPLHTWDSIEEVSRTIFIDQNRWVYRGQKDSQWPLATTIERALKATGINLSEAWRIEGGATTPLPEAGSSSH